MKKTLILSVIALFVLLVLAGWAYLFMFGAPKGTGDIFANFGFGGEPRFEEQPNVLVDTLDARDGIPENLRQLTTKPVAGGVFVDPQTIVYAERGTGYLYRIDLASGSETELSGTTHSKVIDAEFSQSGNAVIFTSESADSLKTTVERLVKHDDGTTGLAVLTSAFNIENAVFAGDGVNVLYTSPGSNGAGLYAYDTSTQRDSALANAPFSQASVSWGSGVYIYTRPAASMTGYVYRLLDGALQHLRAGASGLTAFGYPAGFVTTESTADGARSYAFEDRAYELPLVLFPEKCTGVTSATGTIMCAAPFEYPAGAAYPDDWYKGAISLDDSLWRINIRAGEAEQLAYPMLQVGREIDVSKIIPSPDGLKYLLINKNDDTLWLFQP